MAGVRAPPHGPDSGRTETRAVGQNDSRGSEPHNVSSMFSVRRDGCRSGLLSYHRGEGEGMFLHQIHAVTLHRIAETYSHYKRHLGHCSVDLFAVYCCTVGQCVQNGPLQQTRCTNESLSETDCCSAMLTMCSLYGFCLLLFSISLLLNVNL